MQLEKSSHMCKKVVLLNHECLVLVKKNAIHEWLVIMDNLGRELNQI